MGFLEVIESRRSLRAYEQLPVEEKKLARGLGAAGQAPTAHDTGTCWIGAFDAAAAREVLGLREAWEAVALTSLGYVRESPPPRPRRSLEEPVLRR